MSALVSTNVSISISANPTAVTYTPSNLQVGQDTDINYTVITPGWTIIGVGKANAAAHEYLTYQGTALPETITPLSGDNISPFIPVAPGINSVTVRDLLDATAGVCKCKFSFIFTNGSQILSVDPQVTNDPG